MEELKKETIHLEDGRKADRFVQEEADPATGEAKTTIEVWEEPKIEKKLRQRVVESRRPIVYRREIEHVDENGQVVEKKVESIEPDVRMELREHIRTNDSVSAMNVEENNCYVTQQEIKNLISEGFTTLAKVLRPENNDFTPSKNEFSAQSVIEEKIATENDKTNVMWYVGCVVVTILTGVFIALAFVV